MKAAVTLTVVGIKCDAAGCDYHDDLTELTPGNAASFLDKPCPKCGASLLTLADLTTLHLLWAATAMVNAEVGPVVDDAEIGKFKVAMNGTGNVVYDPPLSL